MLRILFALLAPAILLPAQSFVETVAGTTWIFPSAPGPATQAPLAAMQAIVADPSGNLYIADPQNHVVVRIDTRGILSVYAGNGFVGYSGEDLPATQAELDQPTGLAFDAQGDLLIADYGNLRIFRVDRAGLLSTFVGGGTNRNDGAAARSAEIQPFALAVDSRGTVYFSERDRNRVRQIDANGIIRTVAGTGEDGFSPDGAPAIQSKLTRPTGITVDAAGLLYIAEGENHRIRRVRANGTLETFAGTGVAGLSGLNGPAARAELIEPRAVYADRQGNLFIADNLFSGRLLRVDSAGIISNAAPNTVFDNPQGIVISADGATYVTESGRRIVRRLAGGAATVFAGNGRYKFGGDGRPAIAASLNAPQAIAFAANGALLLADSGNSRIRRIRPDGIIETVPTGTLRTPTGLAIDVAGNVFVSDPDDGVIYRITPAGTQSTFFSNAEASPESLAIDTAGNLFVSDPSRAIIFRITPAGAVSTVAGNGTRGFGGDGQDALRAQLHYPGAIALDAAGNLFIADRDNNRVRKVTRAGIISTVAGNGSAAFSGDGGAATAAGLDEVRGLALDAQGNLFISTRSRIRVVDPAGTIRTLAGGTPSGNFGDGGPPLEAGLEPYEIAVARNGDLFFAELYYDVVRAIRFAAPSYTVTPQSLSLSALAGSNEASASVEVRGSTSAIAFTAAATATWLSVSPQSGQTPARLTVTARTAGLAPGTYTANVELTAPLGTPSRTTIPVTVSVTASGPKLSVPVQPLNFTTFENGAPLAATLRVANEGSGTLAFQAAATEPWLSLAPASGSLLAGDFQAVAVTANPAGLRPGTYTARITVTAGAERATLTASLLITPAGAKILLSQSGLSFTAVAGGGQPLPQAFAVLNEGSGTLPFTASVSTLSSTGWLRASARTSTVQRPLLDIAEVDVAVDQRGLAPGEYFGQIRIASPNAAASQSLTVVLRVLPEGANPGPDIQPSGLVFTGAQGSSPASQEVAVTNLLARDITFASGSVTFDGPSWLRHLPANAAVSPGTPRRIVIQSNFSGLSAGIRRGAITLIFDDGTIRTVSILSVVAPAAAPTAKAGERQAGSCGSPRLNLTFTQIGDGATARTGQPFPIELRAFDDCGNPVRGNERNANSAIFAKFDNGDPDLRLIPLGDGRWSGTWRPLNSAKDRVTLSGVAVYVEGLSVQAGRVDRQVALTSSLATPVIRSGAVVHGASQRADVPIAPGSLVTLYGANLAERTTGINPLPLPVEAEGTEVLLGGQALPILFASPGQINAQLPFNLPANSVLQVVVRRRDQISVPEAFVVAPAQPGIFTRNQQGSGQGIVVRSDQVTLAEPGTPARPGEAVVIYGTGLGPVSQTPVAGQPAPGNPLAVALSTVTVEAGGKQAQVLFAGLTPGFAGLYQVNAILAADTPSGNAVPLLLRVDGQESNTVEIAVQNP
jgi:uncharacterized protein (TIGR03437 family)